MSRVTPHLDALHLAQLDGDVVQLVFLRGGCRWWKTEER